MPISITVYGGYSMPISITANTSKRVQESFNCLCVIKLIILKYINNSLLMTGNVDISLPFAII